MRIVIGIQCFPPRFGGFPLGTLGGVRATFAIGIGFFVRRDQTRARTTFDGHVTDGHAPFHRQIADRFAAIFNDIASAAGCAGLADNRQGDVLGSDAGGQLACDLDFHVLALALDQRLGGKDMFNFGRADAVGQRAKSAVGRRVAVTTDNGHAGQGPTLFRANDVHNALTDIGHGVIVNAKILGVLVERIDLNTAILGHGGSIGAIQRGGHVVIGNGNGLVRCVNRPSCHAQPLKGLRAGHFVHQMAVDIQQACAVFGLVGNVSIPDFVVKCLGGHVVLSLGCDVETNRRQQQASDA